MASNIPAKLRTPDIVRYVQRATQLENIKPPIAYWCYYWVVNQILAKSLHQTDEECMNYTTQLVEKLETVKARYPGDGSINDDVAGQAYVEQFGLETFHRAENAIRANKASKQTAETFQAAATFLELVQIWSPPDPEIAAKIKFAKYHALRIARALKAGEDPNLSNPPPPDGALNPQNVPLDPEDPDVQMINAAAAGQPMPPPRQPFVEEIPDEHDTLQSRLARQSSIDQSLHPSRASSLPRPPGNSSAPDTNPGAAPNIPRPADEYPPPNGALPSPLQNQDDARAAPFAPPTNPRQDSFGGGYFPEVATPFSPQNERQEHSYADAPQSPAISLPPAASTALPGDAQDFTQEYYYPPPFNATSLPPFSPPIQGPTSAAPTFASPTAPSPAHPFSPPLPRQNFPTHAPQPQTYSYPQAPPPQSQSQRQPQAQPIYQSIPQQPSGPQSYLTDDDAVMQAQKHAKWAMSALNFEDVPTAVKELRAALKSLGAQ